MHDRVSGIIVSGIILTDTRVGRGESAACAWLVPVMHELYATSSTLGTNPLEFVHYLYCSLLLYAQRALICLCDLHCK